VPPAWLAELPGTGVSAITVANNHACDLGVSGVDATLAAADAVGLVAVGGDAEDPWTPRVLAERGDKRVCAVAWTTFVNAAGTCARSPRLAIAPPNAAGRVRVAAAIERARASCDATIAILHGGEEYQPQTLAMMAEAKHAADAGADAVVVHHPHVASPVVVHQARGGRRVPIFASVGNLVSNQGESWTPAMFPVLRENRRLVCVNGWTRLGVLADLAFDLDGEGARLAWGYRLIWTDNEHALDRSVAVPRIEARLLEPARDAEIIARLREDRRGPVALFSDPCWLDGAPGGRPRCTEAEIVGTATPPTVARARRTPAPARAFDRRRARDDNPRHDRSGKGRPKSSNPRREARPRRP
jgi:hypothetical protein